MKKGRIVLYTTITLLVIAIAVAVVLMAVNASGRGENKKVKPETICVQVGDSEIHMSIEIPEGWEYESSGLNDSFIEEKIYKISFWPKGSTEGKLTLRGSRQLFGVCGTGLVEKQSTIGKYQVNQGFYDGKNIWDYTTFSDYEYYTLINDGASTWWHEYEEEMNLILETIELKKVREDIDMSTEGAMTEFGLRLFQESLAPEGNSVISPISVLYALAMTANGAEGETLAQMEEVFGLSVSELNEFLSTYMNALPEGEKYKLNLANAIWFEENANFDVSDEFLKTNEEVYHAGIYEAQFDKQTVREINEWVSEKTKGRIKNLLSELSDDAVMCLVNALSFDAEWDKIYEDNQVREEQFTTEEGTRQNAEFMFAKENKYIETENATGFLKYYKDSKYAFVALLPRETLSVETYIDSLNGEELHQMIKNAASIEVKTSIPKFTASQSVDMLKVLMKMGMEKPFDAEQANLLGIGTVPTGYNLFISQIAHKAFISVHELGTEAGAATAVVVNKATSARPLYEPKEVYLDRPFVYLIVDCESNLPIFMGTVMEVSNR